jgi:hypothetical protein
MGETKKEGASTAAGIAIVSGLVALPLGIPLFFIFAWPHLHGATPQQLMDESLERTPKQLAHDLPASELRGTSVRVDFKKGAAGPYERADFSWSSKKSGAANEMRLRVEWHSHEHNGPEARAALARHFHALHDGRHRWGPVTIRVNNDEGDVSFSVDPGTGGKLNKLFDRQIEAAKEVVLNAAFNLPLRVSDHDLQDLLGSGYSPMQVATLDLSVPVERSVAAVTAKFPAAISSGSSSIKIPLDHPIVGPLRISWRNQPGGRVDYLDLGTTDAYKASRQTFEACLEKKAGPPKVDVTDYAAGRKDYVFVFGGGTITFKLGESSTSVSVAQPSLDQAAFTAFMQSIDACRETAEAGGLTK